MGEERMRICGMQITCDRCKSVIFVKQNGEIERDGGFTRTPTYESADGWKTAFVNKRTLDLCEDCYVLYVLIKARYDAEL